MKEPTLVVALWAAVAALAGLVGLGLRAILTGKLVPKSTLDRAYAESDKWEQAWHLSQETLRETVQQGMHDLGGRMDANTEGLRLVERFMEALPARGRTR